MTTDACMTTDSWLPVPILTYHAVEDAPRPPRYKHFYVTAREFADQMRWLHRTGYQAVTFGDLALALAGNKPLPPKPVLLTFDDGYANLRANVHPLLRELNFPYTVFLVSEKVGETNDWVAAEGYEPTPLLGWKDIKQMQAEDGVDFGSHTATHPRLSSLSREDARRELSSAKDRLEQELQRPIRTLCYPYGDCDDAVVQAVREVGYALAVTTEFGRVRRDDDPLRLPRISLYHVPPLSLTYGVGPLNFRWRVRSRKDVRGLPFPKAES